MVGESAESFEREAAPPLGRVKFPDDPDIRVRLSDNFRAELERRDPREVAEQLAELSGDVRLHPSSITRYAQGKIAPKLGVARQLAKVLDWPMVEALAGYSERHSQPSLDWARVLLYARHFRRRAVAFLEMFRAIIIPNTHFGFPNDRGRAWRRQVRPARDETGYACFEVILDEPVILDKPVGTGTSFDLVVSYCLFERPRVFIDFGEITITEHEVRSVEIWTRRADRAPLVSSARSFWVATWIDGKAVDFVVRSSRAFAVSATMVPEGSLSPKPRTMVRFKPGPIHKYELAEGSAAESGD